jgi:hypothetical protein
MGQHQLTIKILDIRFVGARTPQKIFDEVNNPKGTKVIIETPYDDYLYDLETHKSFIIIPCPYMEDKGDRWQITGPASLSKATICDLLQELLSAT